MACLSELVFVELELLQEGDDRLWVAALPCPGGRSEVSLLASGLDSGLRPHGELLRFEAQPLLERLECLIRTTSPHPLILPGTPAAWKRTKTPDLERAG
jgi:hypothetical protein